jgi:universal stress protein E
MQHPSPAIRRILAATDFSCGAEQAVRRAARLAAQHRAELLLLHAVDPGPWLVLRDLQDGEPDLQARLAGQAEILLASTARSLASASEAGTGASVRTRCAQGRPLDAIVQASEAADLVVLGSSGEHPLRDATLGSTADRLCRALERPLLIVRGSAQAAYRQVLAAVDFSAASVRALALAAALAPHAKLHLLHGIELPALGRMRLAGVEEQAVIRFKAQALHRCAERLRELAASLGLQERVTFDVQVADIRFELLEQARAHVADLVAVGKVGHSRLANALLGSVTAWTAARASCDVLVAPGG